MKFTSRYLKIVVVGEKVEFFSWEDSCRAHLQHLLFFLETHVLWFNYYASVVSGLFSKACTLYLLSFTAVCVCACMRACVRVCVCVCVCVCV